MVRYASLQALVQAQGIQMGRILVTIGSSIVLVQLQYILPKRDFHEATNSARTTARRRRRVTLLLSNEKPHSEGKNANPSY